MCRISSANCFISGFTASQSPQLRLRSVVGYTLLISLLFCFTFASKVFLYVIRRKVRLKSIVELRASSDNVGESFGTAEFIDKNGTLITNAHVVTYTRLGTVYQFENYSIRFSDEEDYYPVELVKYDVEIDIAVLRICESSSCKFNVIKNGKSSNLKSGDKVYAIGNTVNYGLSISQGIVGIPLLNIEYSGAVRTVIQCDLTIADGNSGGALLDSRGRLVGITTFRTKDRLGNIVYGIAYCIPIDIVMGFVEE